MLRRIRLTTLLLAVLTSASQVARAEENVLPGGLVHLRRIDPTILQDMRYATSDNFTGMPVPGYDAAECILLRPVAEALSRIQAGLARSGLSLKVYDCYRPLRAVRALVRWTAQTPPDDDRSYHHPRTSRSRLVALGYIAVASAHSRGDTVDITIVERSASAAPGHNQRVRAATGDCTSPESDRRPDSSVDMGTSFDCFDSRSAMSSQLVGPAQRRWRLKLNEAMTRGGFAGYDREWWHFSFELADRTSWDIPVTRAEMVTAPRSAP